MKTCRSVSLSLALALAGGLTAGAIAEDTAPPAKPARTVDQPAAVKAARSGRLTDKQLAALLVLQQQQEVELGMWATQQADSDQVKAFARSMATQHSEMIAELHTAGLESEVHKEAQLGEVLKNLAQRVQARTADGRERVVLGFRGESDEPGEPATRRGERRDDRQQVREERSDVREARQERQEARRSDENEDGANRRDARGERREARQQVRDERQDLRQERRQAEPREERREELRELVRDSMPILRDNLPELLELVGDAIEDSGGDAMATAWIEFQGKIAEKNVQSVKDHLQKQEGRNFDEAFLAYQLGSHMQMINTLEVARNYASGELGETIDKMLAQAQKHQQEAQQLMEQFEDPQPTTGAAGR